MDLDETYHVIVNVRVLEKDEDLAGATVVEMERGGDQRPLCPLCVNAALGDQHHGEFPAKRDGRDLNVWMFPAGVPAKVIEGLRRHLLDPDDHDPSVHSCYEEERRKYHEQEAEHLASKQKHHELQARRESGWSLEGLDEH